MLDHQNNWRERTWKDPVDGYRRLVERTAARRASRRRFLDAIKLIAGCADCGYVAQAIALDFDHVSGEKLRDVSQLIQASWERLNAEIAKCEVVCANCHRIRTEIRRCATI